MCVVDVVVSKCIICTTRSPLEAATDNCTGTRSHNHWPIHYNIVLNYYT